MELMVELMLKGPKDSTAEQFAERLENVGAMLFSEVGEEHCIIGIRMLSKYSQELLPLFWQMIVEPAFEEKEFNRIKREMQTALQAETTDPSTIAQRHFFAALTGPQHPAHNYRSLSTIKKIQLSHVKKFYEDYFSPENGTVVVVGDFESDALCGRWEDVFMKWQHTRGKNPCIAPKTEPVVKSIVRLIDKPDLTQTSLIVGHNTPGEDDPDRDAASIANYILGAGNFSSRLMTQIRSDGGQTYGITSQFIYGKEFGAFLISTSTQNAQLNEVLGSIMNVYKQFCENGVEEDELEKAKQFAVGNMAFQLEGINNIADKLLWLRLRGRGNAYLENFKSRLDKIDLSDINAAVKKYFFPEPLIIVAVGRKTELLDQVKGFGEVKSYHFRQQI